MEKGIFFTKNAGQTQKLAADIVKRLAGKKVGKTALVLALAGELGGGKTTFVQGLAKALGVKERILSPTFVIMRRFDIKILGYYDIKNLYHIDCYRLEKSEDLVELGLKEILKNPQNLVVIEWADKVKEIIPKNAVWLKFEWASENKRKIYKF
jgi:tRNA threonylcarbamoyladenosine biosynthesis protein TsaE